MGVGKQAEEKACPKTETFHTCSHFIFRSPYEACTLLPPFKG